VPAPNQREAIQNAPRSQRRAKRNENGGGPYREGGLKREDRRTGIRPCTGRTHGARGRTITAGMSPATAGLPTVVDARCLAGDQSCLSTSRIAADRGAEAKSGPGRLRAPKHAIHGRTNPSDAQPAYAAPSPGRNSTRIKLAGPRNTAAVRNIPTNMLAYFAGEALCRGIETATKRTISFRRRMIQVREEGPAWGAIGAIEGFLPQLRSSALGSGRKGYPKRTISRGVPPVGGAPPNSAGRLVNTG